MSDPEPISISLSDVEALLINEADLLNQADLGNSLRWVLALGLTVLVCLIWVVVRHLLRRKRQILADDPLNLFNEICTAHSLSWSQQRALLKLAKCLSIANPCLLLLDTALWPQENDPRISRGLANQLCEVHRALFVGAL